MKWIDGHCHLADPRLEQDLDEVIARSRMLGIEGWVQGGVDPEDWQRQRRVRGKYGSGVILSFGLHPWWVSDADSERLKEGLGRLERELGEAQALGEVGLDYASRYYREETENLQREAFEAQVALANRFSKPLIFHIVRAHGPSVELLKKHAPFEAGGIVHFFSGSEDIARQYLDLGFLISVGGAVTREGFKKMKNALSYLPADRIVIETDAPDQMPELSPEDRSGAAGINEPANLIGIAKAVGGIRGEDWQELLFRSTDNLKRLFGIERN